MNDDLPPEAQRRQQLFAIAAASSDYGPVHAEMQRLLDAGLTREAALADLNSLCALLPETQENVVLDVMDGLVGYCAPWYRLIPRPGPLEQAKIENWKTAMRAAIIRLQERGSDLLGYEIDADEDRLVDAAGPIDTELPGQLADLYQSVERLSLPNVGKGHFIHPYHTIADQPGRARTRYLNGPIWVFGSNGGGGLYAVSERGQVWLLRDGPIDDGVYTDGRGDTPIADDIDTFLSSLRWWVEHFAQTGEAPWW